MIRDYVNNQNLRREKGEGKEGWEGHELAVNGFKMQQFLNFVLVFKLRHHQRGEGRV